MQHGWGKSIVCRVLLRNPEEEMRVVRPIYIDGRIMLKCVLEIG